VSGILHVCKEGNELEALRAGVVTGDKLYWNTTTPPSMTLSAY
jgi:hypothetical protein